MAHTQAVSTPIQGGTVRAARTGCFFYHYRTFQPISHFKPGRMYRINLLSEKKGMDTFKEFESNFIAICESHYKDDRALCFAFILYRDRDANIVRILTDRPCWDALHEISGKYLTVFSFIKSVEEQQRFAPTAFMTSVDVNTKPSVASNHILERYFSLPDEITYPAILFFQVSKDEIIQEFVVPLKEEEFEKGFLEIKKIFQIAEQTLKQIKVKKNREEIISRVILDLESDKSIRIIRSRIQSAKNLAKFFAPFRHLLGFP